MKTLIILLLFGYLANAQDGYLVSYMQGNVLVWEQPSSCTPLVGDSFPDDNAASYCPVNAVGDWDNDGSEVDITTTTVSGNPVMDFEIPSSSTLGYDYVQIDVPVSNGVSISVSFDYRVVVSITTGNQQLRGWSGITSSPNTNLNDDGDWHTFTGSYTTNSTTFTPVIWLASYSGVGANCRVQVQNFTVIE